MENSDKPAPDYLPDGSISLHGSLATKAYITYDVGKNGAKIPRLVNTGPTQTDLFKRMNQDIDTAFGKN